MKKVALAVLMVLLISSLTFIGCSKEEAAEAPKATAEPMAPKVVTMAGPFVDSDAVKFEAAIKAWEEETGIDIQYDGSKEFEASIRIRVEGGDAPDIADFPQPGLLKDFVAKGFVLDLNETLDMNKVGSNYIQSWLDMATMDGPDGPIMAGVWARTNGKSLVWYNKAEFDAAGYEVPENWDELMALQAQIIADGDTPWAVGIASGAATGWPMTDWVEEMMLRTTSLENYDKWVAGELPFDSPEVRAAIESINELWLADGAVYGGTSAVATTAFGDAPTVMFEAPPKAWLHKQGNFITSFFPEGVSYDFFYLPSKDESLGRPVLVAGDIYSMFNDRPEVVEAMEFFATGESLKGWIMSGGVISPHKDASLDWYTNPVERQVAEIIQDATSVRFDGSDLMPGAVGAGSFWTEMTAYVSGAKSLDEALAAIDASWP